MSSLQCNRAAVHHHLGDEFRFVKSNIKLGSGGSGAVFLGRCRHTHAHVAIKQSFRQPVHAPPCPEEHDTRNQYANEDEPLTRRHTLVFSEPREELSFTLDDEVEHKILERASPHENVVPFLGVTHLSSHFAMELGHSDLKNEIRHQNAEIVNETICQFLLHDVLCGVQHIHSKGVAHRDLKPSNILLKYDPCRYPLGIRVMIGDFGAAHYLTDAFVRRVPINMRGTISYIAPESFFGKVTGSRADRCDMWAVGCIMYELLAGGVAFVGDTGLQVINSMSDLLGLIVVDMSVGMKRDPSKEEKLFRGKSHLSDNCIDLMRKLLAYDPDTRISAEEALAHPFFDTVAEYYASNAGRIASDNAHLVGSCPPMVTLHGQFQYNAEACEFRDIHEHHEHQLHSFNASSEASTIIAGNGQSQHCAYDDSRLSSNITMSNMRTNALFDNSALDASGASGINTSNNAQRFALQSQHLNHLHGGTVGLQSPAPSACKLLDFETPPRDGQLSRRPTPPPHMNL